MSDSAGKPGLEIRLYTAGKGPNSAMAIENLRMMCRRQAVGENAFELIDLAIDSTRALADRVFLTPMLVIRQGEEEWRFVGNLSMDEAVIRVLAQVSPRDV